MAKYRSFSFEFKRQVVLDFLEGRVELRGLARQHNLSRHLIRMWIQKYEAGQLNDEVADATRIAEYETKIAELERKVGQLTMEVDLLKKGARWVRRANGESSSIVSGPKPSRSPEDAES
jgi:transposase